MSLEKRQSQGNHVYLKFKSLDIHLEKELWLWIQNYYFNTEKARKTLLLWRGMYRSCVGVCIFFSTLCVCSAMSDSL